MKIFESEKKIFSKNQIRKKTFFWELQVPKSSKTEFYRKTRIILARDNFWIFMSPCGTNILLKVRTLKNRTFKNGAKSCRFVTFFPGYAILGNVSFSTRKLRKRFLDTKGVFTTWKQRFLFAKLNPQQCFYSWPLISYSPNWQRAFVKVHVLNN